MALALGLAAIALGQRADAELSPIVPPVENPITEAKRVLGKILFWDEQLSSDAPEAVREALAGAHGYAVRHRDLIARFGRFPHRNAALGREMTAAEQAFLDSGGYSA